MKETSYLVEIISSRRRRMIRTGPLYFTSNSRSILHQLKVFGGELLLNTVSVPLKKNSEETLAEENLISP